MAIHNKGMITTCPNLVKLIPDDDLQIFSYKIYSTGMKILLLSRFVGRGASKLSLLLNIVLCHSLIHTHTL